MSVCAGCGTPVEHSATKPRKWCSERCRKAQYDLVCVDCGGRADGSTPSRTDGRDPRCNLCVRVQRRDDARARIVGRIRDWAERFGDPPGAADWNHAQARRERRPAAAVRIAGTEDEWWPKASCVQRVFGSWNAAIEAAGFQPMRRGQQRETWKPRARG